MGLLPTTVTSTFVRLEKGEGNHFDWPLVRGARPSGTLKMEDAKARGVWLLLLQGEKVVSRANPDILRASASFAPAGHLQSDRFGQRTIPSFSLPIRNCGYPSRQARKGSLSLLSWKKKSPLRSSARPRRRSLRYLKTGLQTISSRPLAFRQGAFLFNNRSVLIFAPAIE